MICLIVLTDGRQGVLDTTLKSADRFLGEIQHRVMVDDSQNPAYAVKLDDEYGDAFDIRHAPQSLGFDGAIRQAWSMVPPGTKYVFHLEDDFRFLEPVPLPDMRSLLDRRADIVQVALKRQPWGEREIRVGGFMELSPDGYKDQEFQGFRWCEHQIFFTTNPSLYRATLIEHGWPKGARSEYRFFQNLVAKNSRAKFAYVGHRADPPRVQHIGLHRAGTGY